MHVDTAAGRSSPFPTDVAARIEEALAPAPPEAGASVRPPRA